MTIKADINWTDDADAASALLAMATWIQSMRETPGVDRITVEAVVRVDGAPSPTAASAQIERIGRWLHEHDPDEFWTDDDTATSMIAAANRLRGTVRRFEHVLEAHDSDVFADFVAGNIDLPTAIDAVIASYKAALAALRHDLATANANNAALVTELSTCYAERDRLRSQLAKAGTE